MSTHERIPTLSVKLSGQSDYVDWRDAAEAILDVYEILEIVEGTEIRKNDAETDASPTEKAAVTKSQEEWDKKNKWARAFLIHNIGREVHRAMEKSKIASIMWKALEDTFDRKTKSTLHEHCGELFTLRYTPEVGLKEHVTNFANKWSILLDRTQQHAKETKGFGYAMNIVAKDSESKAAFLLLSVRHPSMENVIDNLETKEGLSYVDAYTKLMDIATRREGTKEVEVLNANKAPPSNGKICMYCKERDMKFEGHLAKECRKKQKAKKEGKYTANMGVADMNATCFMAHTSPIHPYPTYTSFLESCWVNTDYPEFSTSSINFNEEIQDLNWIEPPTDKDMEGIEAYVTGSGKKGQWVFDTGATDHMSASLVTHSLSSMATVSVAGGSKLKVTGIGEAILRVPQGLITIKKVLHVPELGNNSLLSWQKLANQGFTMSGKGSTIEISLNKVLKAVATLDPIRNLYMLGEATPSAHTAQVCEDYSVWHQRLGHLPASSLQKLRKLVEDPQNLPTSASQESCKDCLLSKSVKLPTTGPGSKTTSPLELIHSDLSGKFSVQARGGFQYYITFIDDFSRYAHIYLLKTKDGALAAFKQYTSSVENQLNTKIKRLRTDNGGEYVNQAFSEFLKTKGITHEPIAPYSHESNGKAERFNRTIMQMVRTSLLSSKLPKNMWGEAINTAVYVKNRLPHSALSTTPFQAFSGRKPTIGHLRTFGETGYAHISVEARPAGSKLDARAREVRICGFGGSTGIYRVYDPVKLQVFMSRNVRFGSPSIGEDQKNIDSDSDSDDEYISNSSSEEESEEESEEKEMELEETKEERPGPPNKETEEEEEVGDKRIPYDFDEYEDSDSDTQQLLREANKRIPESLLDDDSKFLLDESFVPGSFLDNSDYPVADPESPSPLAPRRSGRISRPPSRFGEYEAHLASSEPKTYMQAMAGEERMEWEAAMKEEYDALIQNKVWKVVPRPHGKKVVGSRWHFVHKLGPQGEVIRHKARFVAKGFSQVKGIDYQETFSPVFRYESLRILFALVASLPHKNWKTKQRDVKNAFLNGVLKEEVLIEQPQGFTQGKDSVLRLQKALYGLKQSPREWHNILCTALAEKGVRKTNFDPSIFMNVSGTIIIAAFVDDLGSFYQDEDEEASLFRHLETKFKMTGGEPINWMVGINIISSDTNIRLTQTAYLQRVLERFGMNECRPVSTPIENHSLVVNTGPAEETTEFQAIIGSLMYAAVGTRPDIAYATTYLAQFASHPGPEHWVAAKRVLRYIKGTLEFGLTYHKTTNIKTKIIGYADASYASNIPDRKSFSGQCFLINDCLVSWKASKQKSIASSTTEAEYMSLSQASRQMIWMRQAMKDLRVKSTYELKGDNTGSLSLAKNPVFHNRSKHIDVHYHFIREKLAEKLFSLTYVPTNDNYADLFTKGLDKTKHQLFSSKIHCDSPGEVLK